MKIKNVQFVTGLHGNEKLPIVALARIGISQVVANPMALAKNKRFIEKDMNASFGTKGHTYEEKEARKLLKRLDKRKIILDLHTNQSMDIPFAIVVDRKMVKFASKLGLSKIVIMKFNIKGGHSLIDYRKGISVEVGKHESIKSVETTIRIVNNLEKPRKRKIILYEVFGIIKKPGKYVNFRRHKDGFVPLFAGKNSYNNYGLKAKVV